MKVQDLMTSNVERIESGDSVLEAAKIMLEQDVGFLPVSRDGKLIGVITDRDIVLRVVAEAHDPSRTLVDEAMTPGVDCCYEDEDVQEVAHHMAELSVTRLPVLDHAEQLVGVVSLDDIGPQVNFKPGGYSPTMGAVLP